MRREEERKTEREREREKRDVMEREEGDGIEKWHTQWCIAKQSKAAA